MIKDRLHVETVQRMMRKSAVLPNDLQKPYRMEKAKYHHFCQALTCTEDTSENQHMVANQVM